MNGLWIPLLTVAGCVAGLAAIAWSDARGQAHTRSERVHR